MDVPLEVCVKALSVGESDDLSQLFSECFLLYYDDYFIANYLDIGTKFHGINKNDIKNGIDICKARSVLTNHFIQHNINRNNSIFLCQNPSFDRAFFHQIISSKLSEELMLPYHWLDLASMFWAKKEMKNSYKKDFCFNVLSKDFIAGQLGIFPESKPHRAEAGVDHLIQCYMALHEK